MSRHPLSVQAPDVRDLYKQGLSLAEAALVLGINKEAVRARARRAGITWVGRDECYSPFDAMSEAERVASLHKAEQRLLCALAHAFQRGEHLPQRRAA